ncbi:MAG: glutathione S-transferase family protein [Pseudomonadota bacterium]
MGLLVDGTWQDKWYDTDKTGGSFERQASQLRNWVTADGRAGPTGESGFKAEAGRYHLYVSLACPWAHRALIFRKLKGLEDAIDVSVVHPLMLEHGWTFETDFAGATGDRLGKASKLFEVYVKARPDYTGRVTVPLLWDKHQDKAVNNESSEIIRMFNSAFDDIGSGANGPDYYPSDLQAEIDAVNERVYHDVNNGVYKAGFATTQKAYETAFDDLFAALDWLDGRLGETRYLVGDQITEADWRLFTTLVRFDAVYVGHFKCNKQRIADYPNLSGYLRELYQVPAARETTDFDHIKTHYYASHHMINPTRIVPKGPELDLLAPHGRDCG